MKVVEIMKLGQKWLELLQKSCIKLEDIRYLEMYEEYVSMVEKGLKKSHIVATLVEAYHVSERQIYYIVKKFSQDCTIAAVE